MRGLILAQPWAGLLASGLKVNAAGEIVEFRNREIRIREQVAIYAGHCIPCARCPDNWWPDYNVGEKACCAESRAQAATVLHPGHILCLATLSDCRPVAEADRRVPGCPQDLSGFAWVFTDLLALPQPVPCRPKRGAQTWFEVPSDVEEEVLLQTREGKGESDE